ncbi:MAG: hypothetical protein K6E42_07725 [Synergistes sp.]|nr:hypothetical protein [Synergistes sp.]
MNKRCTNSSCRRTFSTLRYGGKCPFCGKLYPQIFSARKKPKGTGWLDRSTWLYIKDRRTVSINIAESYRFLREGEKIKAIKALVYALRDRGYSPGLKNAKYFIDNVLAGRPVCRAWVLDGGKANCWGKIVKTVIPEWRYPQA